MSKAASKVVMLEFVIDKFKPDLIRYRKVRQLGSLTDVRGDTINAKALFIAELCKEKSPYENPENKNGVENTNWLFYE